MSTAIYRKAGCLIDRETDNFGQRKKLRIWFSDTDFLLEFNKIHIKSVLMIKNCHSECDTYLFVIIYSFVNFIHSKIKFSF